MQAAEMQLYFEFLKIKKSPSDGHAEGDFEAED
jgi:hypothetical protein